MALPFLALWMGSGSAQAQNLFPGASWRADPVNYASHFGGSVAAAGDVNADGFADFVVGVPCASVGYLACAGGFALYRGSPAGPVNPPTARTPVAQAHARAGDEGALGSAGDVNGDGYDDVVVGAPEYDNQAVDEGKAFLYLGSSTGLQANFAWSAEPVNREALFGRAVASAGDVNGDGFDDVIVGAPSFTETGLNKPTAEGRAYVYLGSAAGLSASAAWTSDPTNDAGAQFGWSVASAGDVDADGYDDVIVAAPWKSTAGEVYLFRGSSAGLPAAPTTTLAALPDSLWFGYSVSSAGDVNGDGYDDVVVGDAQYTSNPYVFPAEGAIHVYLGSAAGLQTVPARTVRGQNAGAQFGWSVATAGDLNGDGRAEVVAGAENGSYPQSGEGAVLVYLGTATGIAANPAVRLESNQVSAQFGSSVAGVGDVNGDGVGDILGGAPRYTDQVEEGAAVLYYGP